MAFTVYYDANDSQMLNQWRHLKTRSLKELYNAETTKKKTKQKKKRALESGRQEESRRNYVFVFDPRQVT